MRPRTQRAWPRAPSPRSAAYFKVHFRRAATGDATADAYARRDSRHSPPQRRNESKYRSRYNATWTCDHAARAGRDFAWGGGARWDRTGRDAVLRAVRRVARPDRENPDGSIGGTGIQVLLTAVCTDTTSTDAGGRRDDRMRIELAVEFRVRFGTGYQRCTCSSPFRSRIVPSRAHRQITPHKRIPHPRVNTSIKTLRPKAKKALLAD